MALDPRSHPPSHEGHAEKPHQVVGVDFTKPTTLERVEGKGVLARFILHAVPAFLAGALGPQPGVLRRDLVQDSLFQSGNAPSPLDVQDMPFHLGGPQFVGPVKLLEYLVIRRRRVPQIIDAGLFDGVEALLSSSPLALRYQVE